MAVNDFQELLNGVELSSGDVLLPLVHNTTYAAFEKIISKGHLELRYCDVFKKKLLYFFYGKCEYKVSEDLPALYAKGQLPACFIVKTRMVDPIHAIYPFDTGAYFRGLFNKHFSSEYNIKEFTLGNNMNDIMQFVKLFYANNRKYVESKAQDINNPSLIIDEYIDLVRAEWDDSFDGRRSAAEVQVTNRVSIHNNLEAIIIPRRYQGNDCIRRLVRNGVNIIPYDLFQCTKPSAYNEVIRQKLIDYYIEKGYMS